MTRQQPRMMWSCLQAGNGRKTGRLISTEQSMKTVSYLNNVHNLWFIIHVYASANNSRCRALCVRVIRRSVRPPDVCPSVRPLSINIYFAWRDITVHSGGFQWNSARIFIMLVGIAEKVFKVRGQRSRSKRNKMHFCGGWRHTFRPCGVEAQLFYIIIPAFETLTSFLWSVYCNFSS